MNDGSDLPPKNHAPLISRALESGVEIGDFRIERRLGAGGMGIVYQAQQLSLRRPVALKVLGQALTRSSDVARFQREAQAAARLRHPAIAQVYYIGQDRHLCYLAMELIDGSSLRQVLDHLGKTASRESSLDSAVANGLAGDGEAEAVRFDQPTELLARVPVNTLPSDPARDANPYLSPEAREMRTTASYVRRVAEVIRDAAAALAHAHEHGVVHRDIKPDNLLLDREGKVHLIDFGVARFFEDQAVTHTGQLVGTPLYMSPEQVTGRGAIDARTDTYSLGLVLYELLTLRAPIEAANREHLLRTIVTKPLIPVDWRNAAVPEDLRRVVHKATQKDPDQRYATAAEMARDLDQFLAGRPVAAPAYHFRLDEREVTAARPGAVVLAAVIFFLIASFLFMAVESLGLMIGIMTVGVAGVSVLVIQTLVAIAILAVGIVIGRGLLAARAWARWIGVALAGLLVMGSLAGIVTLAIVMASVITSVEAQNEQADSKPSAEKTGDGDKQMVTMFSPQRAMLGATAMYELPLVLGFVMGLVLLWTLLCGATANWYRFARELRNEHQQARLSLAA